jgi:hypothetical protein
MIGGRAFHAVLEADASPPDIASSQDNRDFYVQVSEFSDLGCDQGGSIRVDAEAMGIGQSLSPKFEQDAPVADRAHSSL